MPTKKRYTFYGNGIITRNVARFPDDASDTAYATRNSTNDPTAEFEIEQAIDPDQSGDLGNSNIRGRYRINQSLAEIRYGPDGVPYRFVRVTKDNIIIRNADINITMSDSGIEVNGNTNFKDPATVNGVSIAVSNYSIQNHAQETLGYGVSSSSSVQIVIPPGVTALVHFSGNVLYSLATNVQGYLRYTINGSVMWTSSNYLSGSRYVNLERDMLLGSGTYVFRTNGVQSYLYTGIHTSCVIGGSSSNMKVKAIG